jgi:phage/plasmid-like protein (TIGR03299 family)
MTSTTDTQFSTREVPWMKLGKLEEQPKDMEEAIQLGGMNFDVLKQPAGYRDEHGVWKDAPNRLAVVHGKTGEVFDYVSHDYEVLQFRDAFAFLDIVSPKYVAAGVLRGGRQGFIVVENDRVMSPAGDEHKLYTVLRTSHDRSRAVEVSVMPLRGMCMNQLTLSSFAKGAQQRWAIPHTKSMHDKMHQAQMTLTKVDEYADAFERLVEKLTVTTPSEDQARKLLESSVKSGGKGRDEIFDTILHNWHDNEETVGYNDSAWGLVNALSEYLEWQKPKGTAQSRFLNALQGSTRNALSTLTQGCLQLAA